MPGRMTSFKYQRETWKRRRAGGGEGSPRLAPRLPFPPLPYGPLAFPPLSYPPRPPGPAAWEGWSAPRTSEERRPRRPQPPSCPGPRCPLSCCRCWAWSPPPLRVSCPRPRSLPPCPGARPRAVAFTPCPAVTPQPPAARGSRMRALRAHPGAPPGPCVRPPPAPRATPRAAGSESAPGRVAEGPSPPWLPHRGPQPQLAGTASKPGAR